MLSPWLKLGLFVLSSQLRGRRKGVEKQLEKNQFANFVDVITVAKILPWNAHLNAVFQHTGFLLTRYLCP